MSTTFLQATSEMAKAITTKSESCIYFPSFDGKDHSNFHKYLEKLKLLLATDKYKALAWATATTPIRKGVSLKP